MTTPPGILLAGDPLTKISFTIGGRTSFMSRRGAALLWEFQRRANARWPGCVFRLIQPAFNTGVAISQGTHDKFDVWDWELQGVDDWYAESRLARDVGLWDWVRTPAQGFAWHHHAVGAGLPEHMYGDLVPGQMDDYRRHALGLKGRHDSGSDPQCFNSQGALTHSPIVVFNYEDWKDDHMPISDAQINEIATKAGDKAVQKLLDTELTLSDNTTVTVSQVLRRAGQTPGNIDAAVVAVKAQVKASARNTNTKVENSRSAIMAKLSELDEQVG